MRSPNNRKKFQNGGVLIAALVFVIIISTLLAGIGCLCISHYARAATEADYAASLDVAEAGINFELQKISVNRANADQKTLSKPDGIAYPFGAGEFSVYCMNRDETYPWTATDQLYIVAKGTIRGVSRTVKMTARPTSSRNYSIYGVSYATWREKGHVNGDVGSNGTISATKSVDIVGTTVLNGAGANESGAFAATDSASVSQATIWPTVHDIALSRFPLGGLSWLATHNDNALCSSITGGKITSGSGSIAFPGKSGGANYYLTEFKMTGSGTISIDNSLGPVTIWLGPDGADGTVAGVPKFMFQNTVNIVCSSTNTANRCVIYDSTTGPFSIQSDGVMNVGIYAYNHDGGGSSIGSVKFEGSCTLNGAVIANSVSFNSESWINYSDGYFMDPAVKRFSYDDQWTELNSL